MRAFLFPLCVIVFFSCQNSKGIAYKNTMAERSDRTSTVDVPAYTAIVSSEDTTFVNIRDYSLDFVFDMKYATEDNFMKAKVYDCAECYLRLKTIKALINANVTFLKLGYRIKLFDCYRPLTIQKRMWAIVNNPSYVADPAKGSIHNRGGAVDITIVDGNGNELDMGTPFDFFGKKASQDYKRLPDQIIANRQLLRKVMSENGFQPLTSEWWHYDLNGSRKDDVSDFKWECK